MIMHLDDDESKPQEDDSSLKPILKVSSGSGTLTPNKKVRVKGL